MNTGVILIAAGLASLPLAWAHAGEVPVPADEIRKQIVGRTMNSRAGVGSISVSYTADGRYVFITGRDGGTIVIRGTYEISDGKVCQKPDDRSRPTMCNLITKDGSTVYITTPDKVKRRLESMY